MDCSILSWNVRGLNNPAKRRAVQMFVAETKCNIVCLQETKIEAMTRPLVMETLGPRFADNFLEMPTQGSRGGILLACLEGLEISENNLAAGDYSVSGTITSRADGATWSITGVYGPQAEGDKVLFMEELRRIKQHTLSRWMLLGDFNMIYKASEKSNNNINLRLMGRFRAMIEDLELIDFPLLGRRFTWSNERQNITLTKIDRVLVTNDWEAAFPHYQLSPASTNVSDHCPLILKKMEAAHYKAFRFENHWLKCPEFDGIVTQAWSKEVKSGDPIRVLHTKLYRTARALKEWNKHKKRDMVFLSGVANEVIFMLDLAQEERELSEGERNVRAMLKAKLLGFAAVDRARWRQKSQLTEIKEGDASTRFFHLRASGRRRKNYIPTLKGRDGLVSDHASKAKLLFDRFRELMGSPHGRSAGLNWEELGCQETVWSSWRLLSLNKNYTQRSMICMGKRHPARMDLRELFSNTAGPLSRGIY